MLFIGPVNEEQFEQGFGLGAVPDAQPDSVSPQAELAQSLDAQRRRPGGSGNRIFYSLASKVLLFNKVDNEWIFGY